MKQFCDCAESLVEFLFSFTKEFDSGATFSRDMIGVCDLIFG